MKNLRKWLEEHSYSADASSEDIDALAQKAIADKKLTLKQYVALLDDESGDEDPLAALGDTIASKTATAVAGALSGPLTALADAVKSTKQAAPAETPVTAEAEDDHEHLNFDDPEVQKKLDTMIGKMGYRKVGGDGASLTAWDVLKMGIPADTADPVHVRVKSAVERFDDTRSEAYHTKGAFRGQRMQHNGAHLDNPSQRQKALWAAWFKFEVCPDMLTEHDRDMVLWTLHNERFLGLDADSTVARKMTERERDVAMRATRGQRLTSLKAVIDDGTSGGANAVPEFFDVQGAILPILGMEVFPFVNLIDVPRGSSVDSFTIGNPTMAAANTEGSAVSLFTTTSFIGALDTDIFRVAGAISIGQNWLADAVPGMAELIQSRYRAVHGTWLDEQILAGDGSTEPTGILNANGTVDITLGTPSTGPWVIGDVINLLFGVSKAFRQAFMRNKLAFAMVDQSYKRIRSLATGVTGDTRLIFGDGTGDNGILSYTLFGIPVAIEENGLSGNHAIFGQFGGYRLYRRQGLRFRSTTEGDTNLRNNTMTLVADARYGGQPERGGYFAVIDSAPTE